MGVSRLLRVHTPLPLRVINCLPDRKVGVAARPPIADSKAFTAEAETGQQQTWVPSFLLTIIRCSLLRELLADVPKSRFSFY